MFEDIQDLTVMFDFTEEKKTHALLVSSGIDYGTGDNAPAIIKTMKEHEGKETIEQRTCVITSQESANAFVQDYMKQLSAAVNGNGDFSDAQKDAAQAVLKQLAAIMIKPTNETHEQAVQRSGEATDLFKLFRAIVAEDCSDKLRVFKELHNDHLPDVVEAFYDTVRKISQEKPA